jgi:hypothetical protein
MNALNSVREALDVRRALVLGRYVMRERLRLV